MILRRAAAALAVAAMSAFAPAAHADYTYTCDTVDCFTLWCVDHLGDCRDTSPNWTYCDDSFCVAGSGDILLYVTYCTVMHSPVTCVL